MRRFLDSVTSSLAAENWYAALSVALTVPDMCARLENPKNRRGEHYIAWFDRYLLAVNTMKGRWGGSSDCVFMSGTDCYALRCSFLHAGMDDVSDQKVAEVLQKFHFTTRATHRIRIGNVLVLSVSKFCEEMIGAANDWLAEHVDDAEVQTRLGIMVEVKTEPFSPVPGVRIG